MSLARSLPNIKTTHCYHANLILLNGALFRNGLNRCNALFDKPSFLFVVLGNKVAKLILRKSFDTLPLFFFNTCLHCHCSIALVGNIISSIFYL